MRINPAVARNSSVSLKHSLDSHEHNNFDLIRLMAAVLVLLTHSFELGPEPLYRLTGHLITGSYLGVSVFFFLSGLLVTQSLRHSSSWKNFLWRRFLRIYPAACAVILICALILGPLATEYSLKDYFSHPDFYKFLSGCILFRIHFILPGVWEHVKGVSSPISPFWSIALELKLYIGLLVIGLLKIPGKRVLALSWFIIAFLFNLFFYNQTRSIFNRLIPVHFNPFSYTVLTTLFVAGVLCNLYQEKIKMPDYWIAILAVLCLAGSYFHLLQLTTFITIPLLTLYLATHGMRWTKKIAPRADLSYGIYILGGPVGRIVSIYLHLDSPWANFGCSLLATVPLALLSWYGLEKRMQTFKNQVA